MQTIPEHQDRGDGVEGERFVRRREHDRRGQHERREAEAGGDRPERIEVGERAVDDHRRDRVAERRDEDQGRTGELCGVARHVAADERDDTAEADQQAGDA